MHPLNQQCFAGADDFLPILIYVVIHANPPQLASNLEYIQRFRMQSKMVSESSYFFTQLVRLHCFQSFKGSRGLKGTETSVQSLQVDSASSELSDVCRSLSRPAIS